MSLAALKQQQQFYAAVRRRIDPVKPNVVFIADRIEANKVAAKKRGPRPQHDQHVKTREMQHALERARAEGRLASPSIRAIILATSEHFGIGAADILSLSRVGPILEARQVAMFLSRKLTKRSLPYIAERFAGRDHTTVLNAIRKITAMSKKDPQLAANVEAVERIIVAKASSAGA